MGNPSLKDFFFNFDIFFKKIFLGDKGREQRNIFFWEKSHIFWGQAPRKKGREFILKGILHYLGPIQKPGYLPNY